MLIGPQVGLMGSGGLAALGVAFDGSNDYMTRAALTGATYSKSWIISAWFRLDGGDGSGMRIFSCTQGGAGSDVCYVSRSGANHLYVYFLGGGGNPGAELRTTGSFTSGSTWHHILCSWNSTPAAVGHLYMDDVSDVAASSFGNIASAVDQTAAIGAKTDGGEKFNGCLAEFFLDETYLDLSVEANRRKFITSSLKPVDLGADGSTPLGVQPLIYQSVRAGVAASDFATNRGSGGDFTITGSLDLSTNP